MARIATSVFPKPTSPQINRSIGRELLIMSEATSYAKTIMETIRDAIRILIDITTTLIQTSYIKALSLVRGGFVEKGLFEATIILVIRPARHPLNAVTDCHHVDQVHRHAV